MKLANEKRTPALARWQTPIVWIIEVEMDREASGAGLAPLVSRGRCRLGGCFSRRADGKY